MAKIIENAGVPGWRKEICTRLKGKSKGKLDVYIYSPDGIKFRSKKQLEAYLNVIKKENLLKKISFSAEKFSNDSNACSNIQETKIGKKVLTTQRARKSFPRRPQNAGTPVKSYKSPRKAVCPVSSVNSSSIDPVPSTSGTVKAPKKAVSSPKTNRAVKIPSRRAPSHSLRKSSAKYPSKAMMKASLKNAETAPATRKGVK